MSEVHSLAEMKSKQIGRVREIDGGFGLLSRLESMGIRPGTELRVVNSSFLRGPVTVRTGNSQIALGHGMARKILMEKEIDG